MTMKSIAFIAVLTAGLLGLSSARAASLADGEYYCTLDGSMSLGDIRIAGDHYAGPAYDGNYEGDYPFEVTNAGTINWGGPLGGLEGDGNTVVSTVLTDAGNNRNGFDITIQLASGNFTTASCYPDW